MATDRLTDAAVRGFKPGAKARKEFDGGGLHLLITPSGGKLWRVAYRFGGRQKTLALGAYPHVSLAKARALRDAAKRRLGEGIEPVSPRKGGRVAEPDHGDPTEAQVTFREVAERWFEARKRRWVEGYSDRIWSRVDDDLLKPLGDIAVGDITPSHVLSALRTIEKRSAFEMAKRVRAYAHDIFRYAKAEGAVASNPAAELADALEASPPAKRRAALKARDLPDFLAALAKYDGDLRTRLALSFTLLTFVRPSEARFARWQEFEGLSGDKPIWRIPPERMKMRTEHLVPLAPAVVTALAEIKRTSGKSGFLFPADTKDGVISYNTMIYALYRMGYHSRATVHGFRGTASTILNEEGFNRDWIERQLAHVERNGVRAAYNSAEWLSDRERMMEWWSSYLVAKGLKLPGEALQSHP